MPEELVDERTAFDPSECDIRQALIKSSNCKPKYSGSGGIGRQVNADGLDLVELKVLYAMLHLTSQSNDYDEMKRSYGA